MWKKTQTNCIFNRVFVFGIFGVKNSESFFILIENKIFNTRYHCSFTIYFCDQFVASEIRHSTETSLQDLSTINMAFSDKDKILIKSLHLKRYTAKRSIGKFPEKGWTKRRVNKLLKKLRITGTCQATRQRQTAQCPH